MKIASGNRVPYSLPMFPADTTFMIFDTETTGLDPKNGDRIVEIAAVRIEKGVIKDDQHFVSLVNPQRAIPWEAMRVHGLQEQDLVDAPDIAQVLPQFLEFVNDSILVAHNAEFDMGFLEAEKEMCWGFLEIPECLCTMQLSRSVFPHEFRHNLDVVSQRLELPPPTTRHRALPDVLLTAEALLKLINIGKISSLDALRELASPKAVAWR